MKRKVKPFTQVYLILSARAYITGYNKLNGINLTYQDTLNLFLFLENGIIKSQTLKRFSTNRLNYKLFHSVGKQRNLDAINKLINSGFVESYYSEHYLVKQKDLIRYRLTDKGKNYLILLNEHIENRISKVIK